MIAAVLPDNGDYVAAAYLVFVALLVIYLAIMSTKLGRLERETSELLALAERQDEADAERAKEPA